MRHDEGGRSAVPLPFPPSSVLYLHLLLQLIFLFLMPDVLIFLESGGEPQKVCFSAVASPVKPREVNFAR